MLDKLKTQYFLKVKPLREELNSSSILTCFRGSIAHGMYVPNSDPNSIDDIDAMSVCIAPKSFYFGLDGWGSRGTKEFWEGEWDFVCYELKKFTSLMEKSNPNVLSMLWCDEKYILEVSEQGKILRDNKEIFSTKNIYHSFCGYAYSQLQQMTRNQCLGYMGKKRRSLVEKHGYDTKNAAHLIRLLRMGIEFLDSGVLRVDRSNHDADDLLGIKRGNWELDAIKEYSKYLFEDLKQKKDSCDLPDSPSRDEINKMLKDILESYFYSNVL